MERKLIGMRKYFYCFIVFLVVLSMLTALAAGALPSASVSVPDFTNGASTEEVSVTPDSVFSINILIFSANIISARDISFEFTDYGDLTLIEGFDSVKDFTLGETYRFKFYVPDNFNKEKVYIRYALSYKYDDSTGIETSGKKSFYTTVKSAPSALTDSSVSSLTISGFDYPSNVMQGSDAVFKLDLVNKSTVDFKNAELILYSGTKQITTDYIGLVQAQSKTPFEFSAAFNDTGNRKYKLVIKYDDKSKSQSIEKEFNITVTESKPLEISGIVLPDEINEREMTEIKFSLVNKNKASVSNAHVYLYKGNTIISEVYVGTILPETRSEGAINCRLYAKDDGDYTLRAVYNDHKDREQQVKEIIKINVSETGTGSDSGILKIQSIYTPHEQLTSAECVIEFAVTNPSDTVVKGAEAFVYGEKGKELDSIYISEIKGNSSADYKLRIISESAVGAHTYKLKITYNESGKVKTLEKSFSVNTVDEVKEGDGSVKSEKPANLKIQKIEAPGLIYSGVKTAIQVTFVNAGKGTAYNAELYVLNGAGEETAREYIGSISASESKETSFTLLGEKTGDFKGTLYVTYENADETEGTTSKVFSSQFVEYRINISDITGYEYVMAENPFNIEFSVLNGGTVKMLNTTAYLSDTDGNEYGECYIGSIDPSVKKERQKFNKLIFSTSGQLELIITLAYENEEMQRFEMQSTPFIAEVTEMYVPGEGEMPGVEIDPSIPAEGETAEQGTQPWVIWLAVGGAVVLVAVIVIIIVAVRSKKKKRTSDEEDLDYFYEELRGKAQNSGGSDIQRKD